MKPYRVLMVTGVYPTEGCPHAGTFIKSQVESLIAAGLEVEVLHPKPGPVPLRYATAALQVFLKTWKGRFDIVHGHYGLWCLACRMQWRVPVVASFLGDDLLGTPTADGRYSKKSLLVVCISRWLSRHVQAVIVKSEEMKLVARGKKLSVIPNGVDFDLFRPVARSETRAVLGWKQDGYYVLFANDPHIPRKNYALARAAIECLRARGICAKLVVANGLPQTTVVQYMNASNVLILPSLIEGSPNVVKETMACNVPVVATDVGDVSEVIGQTKGCKVCPFDADALANALEEAIRHTQPTTGRSDIRHLDRKIVAQQVIEIYEWAAQKKVIGSVVRVDSGRSWMEDYGKKL
jgi:glycosyltransferase involved in cell wall biosynthesis